MQPLFTIATITYNSSKWIREAIESILSSTYTDFELLIFDDASDDSTWDIVQEYSDQRIVLNRNEKNIGEYNNRNVALNSARGKYILFIDGDDILYKDTLKKYTNYLEYFQDCDAIWGVEYNKMDFILFPYLLKPYELTMLNYVGGSDFTFLGFTESLFKIEALKAIGGFSNQFVTGDTYIKRKFCCFYNVLIIQNGNAFWRQHPNQASNKNKKDYGGLIENYLMDKEILASDYIPLNGDDLKMAVSNFKVRTIKLLVSKTILKFKFFDFFELVKKMGISASDFSYLSKKIRADYKVNATAEKPLKNEYHFHQIKIISVNP